MNKTMFMYLYRKVNVHHRLNLKIDVNVYFKSFGKNLQII